MEEITALPQVAEEREKFFTELYKSTFPLVAEYISRYGGSFEETKDIFQEALIVYYEKTVTSPDTHIISDQAYILGVAKYLWSKKYKDHRKKSPLTNTTVDRIMEEEPGQTSTEKLIKFLGTAGQKCMALLQSFYYDKLSMTEVAARFNYTSERSATVQKYKCLEKVRTMVKQKLLSYEDFLE